MMSNINVQVNKQAQKEDEYTEQKFIVTLGTGSTSSFESFHVGTFCCGKGSGTLAENYAGEFTHPSTAEITPQLISSYSGIVKCE